MGAAIPSTPRLRCCHHGLDDWFTERCVSQSPGKILTSPGCRFPREAETLWACPEGGRQDGEGCKNGLRATVARSQMKRPDVSEMD